MIRRRGILSGIGLLLAAPAVCKASSLMPVRSATPVADMIEWRANRGLLIPAGTHRIERTIVLNRPGWRLAGVGTIDHRAIPTGVAVLCGTIDGTLGSDMNFYG
ncbi:hypothetical protein M0638_28540 [Roseomonas sp. NAR14]|uniref:Uncharacterized protein n=1 Tax=Roseomonas acroporae TaxID=2937791 RepID=A0A9X1YEM3_9PROT|nr:hypothetical protein [Roseomonas acroporae]MCK8788305.1 hypothetical protein [Roseomonas acroporae]